MKTGLLTKLKTLWEKWLAVSRREPKLEEISGMSYWKSPYFNILFIDILKGKRVIARYVLPKPSIIISPNWTQIPPSPKSSLDKGPPKIPFNA